MKKILMTAAIAIACFAANAQTGPQTVSSINLGIDVQIPDIIVMSRVDNMSTTATYLNSNDFDWCEHVGGWGYFQFKVRSNRHFDVTTDIGSFGFTPVSGVAYNSGIDINNQMTAADFSWHLCYAGEAGESGVLPLLAGATDPHAVGSAGQWWSFPGTVFTGADNGPDQEWNMQFLSCAGWKYTGGDYTATITLTATQN